VRSRTLAAIALYDHVPEAPQRALDATVHQWWERRMVPALRGGKSVVARDDAYALWELLHAVRDNTNLDLRESVPRFFKDFPIEHLLSHYPATYDAAENQYRIGVTRKPANPTCRRPPYRARWSWPWWRSTSTPPKARCCKGG
jgi:hypothetical protein